MTSEHASQNEINDTRSLIPVLAFVLVSLTIVCTLLALMADIRFRTLCRDSVNRIQSNVSSENASIQKLKTSLEGSTAELEATRKSLKAEKATSDQLRGKLSAASQEIDKLREELAATKKQIDEFKAAAEKRSTIVAPSVSPPSSGQSTPESSAAGAHGGQPPASPPVTGATAVDSAGSPIHGTATGSPSAPPSKPATE